MPKREYNSPRKQRMARLHALAKEGGQVGMLATALRAKMDGDLSDDERVDYSRVIHHYTSKGVAIVEKELVVPEKNDPFA